MKFSLQSVVTKTFCRIWDRGWWVGFWSIVLIWLVLLTFLCIQLGSNLLVRWAVPCSSANHRANGVPGERYFIHFDSHSFWLFFISILHFSNIALPVTELRAKRKTKNFEDKQSKSWVFSCIKHMWWLIPPFHSFNSVLQSLCNACGIRYRKKRRQELGLDHKQQQQLRQQHNGEVKTEVKDSSSSSSSGSSNLQAVQKRRLLMGVEEAALLLMTLSSSPTSTLLHG